MAFFESVVDGLGNLSVAGTDLYHLSDAGLVLAVGFAVFALGKVAYDKVTQKEK